ncbi:MAG: hypothetical protein IPN20_26110 [Haliscomenobacter sp.]|nr:hypothetical protein [Haliscomenobacter sp.]
MLFLHQKAHLPCADDQKIFEAGNAPVGTLIVVVGEIERAFSNAHHVVRAYEFGALDRSRMHQRGVGILEDFYAGRAFAVVDREDPFGSIRGVGEQGNAVGMKLRQVQPRRQIDERRGRGGGIKLNNRACGRLVCADPPSVVRRGQSQPGSRIDGHVFHAHHAGNADFFGRFVGLEGLKGASEEEGAQGEDEDKEDERQQNTKDGFHVVGF